jgi:hypothetical protein
VEAGVSVAPQAAADMFDAERKDLRRGMVRRPDLDAMVDVSNVDGYAWPPQGLLPGVPAAVAFANQLLEAKRTESRTDPRTFRGADLLAATRYEEAPAFFDIALSDEMLQLAATYMGEIPVLAKPRLWWTKPDADNPGGPQLFHIGARARPVVVRQAKFLIAMSDVDEDSGPFTFLPLKISDEIVRAIDYEMGEEVPDEVIFRYAKPSDVTRFVGKAGTGIMIDTSRCFHFGRRLQTKERLMLMIQYKWTKDVPLTDRVERSPAFYEKYGDDPVRSLAVPVW